MKSFLVTMIKLSIKVEIKLSTESIGVALDGAGIEVQLAGYCDQSLTVFWNIKYSVHCCDHFNKYYESWFLN